MNLCVLSLKGNKVIIKRVAVSVVSCYFKKGMIVEPPNKGHFGLCRELVHVVLCTEVIGYWRVYC